MRLVLSNSPPRHSQGIRFSDRFIPNRSLMDLDQSHGELTSKGPAKTEYKSDYQKSLKNPTLDAEGRPFRMLVFRGSPKSSRKLSRVINEMRRSDEETIPSNKSLRRAFPRCETRVLDAPGLKKDYYLNIMDWGKTNILAMGLGKKLYLWNADTKGINLLSELNGNDYLTSVSWSEDARIVAAGHKCSKIELYDAETLKLVRHLYTHWTTVGSLAWNGHILTSGSNDRAIINHDVRARNSVTSYAKLHKGKICGLKWSYTGNVLASGGNDNLVYLLDVRKMSSTHYVYRFNKHRAAVKALAWCPHNYNVLASGGGAVDGTLKLWNTQKGTFISSTDTNSQICGLQWNWHHKEIISGHGFGSELGDQLGLWKYPSMSRIGGLCNHISRFYTYPSARMV